MLAQQVDGGLELLVVDNASGDGTAQAARDAGATVLEMTDNLGYAAGNDTAYARTAGELVALVNPDVVLDAGCLQALVDVLDGDPSAGVAAALLRNDDGSWQHVARRHLALPHVLWDLTWSGRRWDRERRQDRGRRRRRYSDEWEAWASGGAPFAVDAAAAACVVVRRADVGPQLFDPGLPLYFNDTDLYDRLQARGLRCVVVPHATATHGYGTSMRRVVSARRRAEYVASMVRYAARWPAHRRLALRALLWADVVTSAVASRRGTNRSSAREHCRGTLGGLGGPAGRRWGARPWLIDPLVDPGAAARRASRPRR